MIVFEGCICNFPVGLPPPQNLKARKKEPSLLQGFPWHFSLVGGHQARNSLTNFYLKRQASKARLIGQDLLLCQLLIAEL